MRWQRKRCCTLTRQTSHYRFGSKNNKNCTIVHPCFFLNQSSIRLFYRFVGAIRLKIPECTQLFRHVGFQSFESSWTNVAFSKEGSHMSYLWRLYSPKLWFSCLLVGTIECLHKYAYIESAESFSIMRFVNANSQLYAKIPCIKLYSNVLQRTISDSVKIFRFTVVWCSLHLNILFFAMLISLKCFFFQ